MAVNRTVDQFPLESFRKGGCGYFSAPSFSFRVQRKRNGTPKPNIAINVGVGWLKFHLRYIVKDVFTCFETRNQVFAIQNS